MKDESVKLTDESTTLNLDYLPPYDWESVLAFFRAHQVPELESVDSKGYERAFATQGRRLGLLRVTHNGPRKRTLRLDLTNVPVNAVATVTKSVRHMFDLDAEPKRIADGMKSDAYLSKLWSLYPGLRVAHSWDRFETLVRTILGQLVSVSFGRTLTRELMQYGTRVRHPKTNEPIFLFPTPEQLTSCDLSVVRTSEMRRTAIRAVASLVRNKTIPLDGPASSKELKKILLSIPGIGPWSAEYVAMRGLGDDDAFPATDYGLKQEIKRHPEMNINNVRPWRAYAATALWKTFTARKGVPDELIL
jgi:3-methyladenine DNA glycosylase/8-oxoguanine DNA glycosylase